MTHELLHTDSPSAISRFHRLIFRLSRSLPVPGFTVRATLPTGSDAALITERLCAALELVQRHSPIRHACLQRDLPCILVGATHNQGECHASIGLCLLRFDHLVAENTTPEDIALLLVHEGMHARLIRAGLRYSGENRARIECLCAKAEWLLATRIGSPRLIGSAEQHRAWPAEMWTDQADTDRRAAALQRLGVEGRVGYWLGSLAAWWARRHSDRAA